MPHPMGFDLVLLANKPSAAWEPLVLPPAEVWESLGVCMVLVLSIRAQSEAGGVGPEHWL